MYDLYILYINMSTSEVSLQDVRKPHGGGV